MQATTRDKILAAAQRLWNERGFALVTVADLAAEAGISTGNLSYHFPTKSDLVLTLYDRAEKRHLDVVVDWTPGEVLAQLPAWVRELCAVMWDYRFLYRDLEQLLVAAPELSKPGRSRLIQVGRKQLRTCLETMADAGHLASPRSEIQAISTSCWIVARYWIDFVVEARAVAWLRRQDVEELVDQLAALVRPHLKPTARRKLQAALAA